MPGEHRAGPNGVQIKSADCGFRRRIRRITISPCETEECINAAGGFSMRIPALAITTILCIGSLQTFAQLRPESSLQDGIAALQKQIGELRTTIEEMKTEIVRARAEAQELRQTLQASREQLNISTPSASADQNAATIQRLEEDQQLLNAKV